MLPDSIARAVYIIHENGLSLWQFGLAACSFSLAVLEEWLGWFEWLVTGPLWAYVSAIALMLVTLEFFSVTEVSIPFVYFQF